MQEDYTVEKEIDLVEQVGRLWLCRRFIVLVALLFLVVGCVVALLLPRFNMRSSPYSSTTSSLVMASSSCMSEVYMGVS